MTPKPANQGTPEQRFARFRDAGDLVALAAVFDAVAGELLVIAGHLVRDGALAEDLLQTTFVEAMRAAPRYDARRPLVPWLVTILTHHARKLQRQQRRAAKALPAAARGERGPLAEVLDREALTAIERGLARLEPPYREVLTLRLVHDLSPAAIAHALGCPPETVRTRCKRGLELLRRRLPAGLGAGLALLLASGRGLAAVRADVVQAGRELAANAAKSTTVTAATAALLGGMVMKQFVVRATVVVAFVLLGGWGVVEMTANATAPGGTAGGASPAAPSLPAESSAVVAIDREAVNAAEQPRDEIVFVGRCVVAGSTTPIAGVPVTVLRPNLPPDVMSNDLTDAHRLAHVTSAADGSFACVCARHDGEYPLHVGGDAHVRRARTFGPYAAGRRVELGDVPLRAGIRVVSKVVDLRGQAVAGVLVDIGPRDTPSRNDALFESSMATGRTGDDGTIAWHQPLLPGKYRAVWWDLASAPVERQGSRFEVAATPARQEHVLVWPVEDASQSIHGIVVDTAGVPIPQLDLGALGAGTRGNARSRQDGTFQIPRIGPFEAVVRGPVAIGLPDATQGFEIVGDVACTWGDRDVRVVVRPAATLTIRAVHAVSGETLRDVHVACAARPDEGGVPRAVWLRPHTCEQRPDGGIVRKLARCVHDVQVFARDAGFAPSAKLAWDPRDGDSLVVPLSPLRTARVRVVAADGVPIAGTEVWALQPIEAVSGAPPAAGWQPVAAPAHTEHFRIDATTRWARDGVGDAPLGNARTDAQGLVRLRVPADADVVFAALGPGHVAAAIVGRVVGDDIVELRVERGATIRLVLSPSELAARLAPPDDLQRLRSLGANDVLVRGASVAVMRVDSNDPTRPQRVATVDLDGVGGSVCHGLAAGEYVLHLTDCMQTSTPGGVLLSRDLTRVTLAAGEERAVAVDLSSLRTGRVRGRVFVNGAPWSSAEGTFSSHPGTPGAVDHALAAVAIDARGEFDVDVPAGRYRLQLYYRGAPGNIGYWRCAESVDVVAGATIDATFTARFVTASVRVVHADGEPAVGLMLTKDCTAEPRGWEKWTTDAQGRVMLDLTHTVPFTLVVANPDGPARAGRRSTSAGDAVLGPFEIPPTGDRAEFRAVLPAGWR